MVVFGQTYARPQDNPARMYLLDLAQGSRPAMAAALKQILDAENIPAAERRINLYTLGTHARRSRRIFQETLGSTWQVGVIAVPSRDYDQTRWYTQSGGAKNVLNELIALTVQSSGGE